MLVMNLQELLNRIPVLEIFGNENPEVSEIVFDSRKAVENSLYVAVKGTVSNGHSFINSAIEKGATIIVCEDLPDNLNEKITYVNVRNSSKTLGQIASNFYGNPSEKLNLIGVTGTNGKTSVTTLLFDILDVYKRQRLHQQKLSGSHFESSARKSLRFGRLYFGDYCHAF